MIVFVATVAFAFGGNAPQSEPSRAPVVITQSGSVPDVFWVDDFESGSLSSPREWWVFDIKATPVPNAALTAGDSSIANKVGKNSLQLKGNANNWYAGGCGTYVAKENTDFSQYNSLQLDIYGNGAGSGTLKIEMIDDDNNNWNAEQDPAKNYLPIYDDKFVYDIRIDWSGWRRVIISLDDFVDDNSSVGDNIFNPSQIAGSGGLLQFQFICLASKSSALVNFNVDNIALLKITD